MTPNQRSAISMLSIRLFSLSLLSGLFMSLFLTQSLHANWPQFRGPTGDGRVNINLPTSWTMSSMKWKTKLPGRGWSSPVISGDRIWLTTAVERNATKAEMAKMKKKIDPKYVKSRSFVGKVDFRALCIDARSGKILKDELLLSLTEPAPVHKTNSFASPTPVMSDGKVYCHFGSYGTWCLDEVTGKEIWSKRVTVNFEVGPGSSPVIVDDKLVLVFDGVDKQFVLALNKKTGREMWRSARPPMRAQSTDHHKAFSTPLLITYQNKKQLIVPAAQWLTSYDPKTGKEIWRYDHGKGFSVIPRPVYKDGVVYFSTGFNRGVMHAVKVNGRGNVTRTHKLWDYGRSVSRMSSFVVGGKAIYQIDEKGVATALEAKTGKVIWTKRLKGAFAASPLLSNGKLYFSNKTGETYVLNAGCKYELLKTNKVAGGFNASLAVYKRSLILRTTEGLYRVD